LAAAHLNSVYLSQSGRSPKRVWVSYSEKYREANTGETYGSESEPDGNGLVAEQRLMWRIKEKPGCIVLSHDRKRADYVAAISVVRLEGGGDRYGEASLSIQEADGDVVAMDHFYQDAQSREDIAQQPVTALWKTLCEKPLTRQ
jgi:hypothetical protein